MNRKEKNLGIFRNFCENGGDNRFSPCRASSLSKEQREDLLDEPGSFIVHSVKMKVFGGTDNGIVSITCETPEGFHELISSLEI